MMAEMWACRLGNPGRLGYARAESNRRMKNCDSDIREFANGDFGK